MSNTKIVQDFIAAWNRNDLNAVAEFFADDIFYHNVPMAPAQGKEAAKAVLNGFGKIDSVNWELLAIAENGNKVLTERIDGFVINGKDIKVPLMGIFEIDGNGKIKVWKDYFDLAQFTSQMA